MTISMTICTKVGQSFFGGLGRIRTCRKMVLSHPRLPIAPRALRASNKTSDSDVRGTRLTSSEGQGPDLCISDSSHQFKPCNLRLGAQADGRAIGSDAAVDVQLAAAFFVSSAHVGSLRVYEGEAPVDERERQLATVGVPGQRQ